MRSHLGQYEIYLDGRLVKTWGLESVGAAYASSTFSSGDANPISESGLWISGDGDWGALQISGGRLRHVTDGVDCAAYITTPTFGPQQIVSANVYDTTSSGNSRDVAVCARMHSGTDESAYIGYSLFNAGDFVVYRTDSAFAFTIVIAAAGTPVTGDKVELTVIGSSIILKQNGAAVLTGTDTNITSGQPGMAFFTASSNLVEADNFVATDLNTTFGRFG
jgi:hypothetical protein